MSRDTASAGIKAVEVGCRLLETLASCAHPLALSDMARRSNMTASQAHRYLVSFQRIGLVQQDTGTRRYALGPFAAELGASAARLFNGRALLEAHQRALRDSLGMTVVLSEWTDRGPVVIKVEDAVSAVIATMRIGTSLPVTTTAAGRIFAAWQTWPKVAPFAEHDIRRARPGLQEQQLQAELALFESGLASIRARGLEHQLNSLSAHINTIAAPFLTSQERLCGVLCVIGDYEALDVSFDGRAAALLRDAQREFRLQSALT